LWARYPCSRSIRPTQRGIRGYFCRNLTTDVLPSVNWLILGSKLPGRVPPEGPIGSRLWPSVTVDVGEIIWLAVKWMGRHQPS